MKNKGTYLLLVAVLGVAAILAGCSLGGGSGPVNLGTAGNFVILAKTGVTNTPTSAITGDIGVSPIDRSGLVGFAFTASGDDSYATSAQVTGRLYAADMFPPTPAMMTAAILDMENAYLDAEGRSNPDYTELYAGDLSGQTLTPGLYKWGTGVVVNSDLTLSGNGVYIFQIAQGLTVAAATDIILAGGAVPEDIFWQLGSAATIGSTSHFEGTILAKTAVTLGTGATVNGRLYAQTAVTLNGNTVVEY